MFGVSHRHIDAQTPVDPAIEVDQVRIDVIEQRSIRSERDREPGRKGLDKPAIRVAVPQRSEVGN
jgi:hypothetical protein